MMNIQNVFLNSFKIKTLDHTEKVVKAYNCNFKRSPKESELSSQLNAIAYHVGCSATRYKDKIITYSSIWQNKLETEEYKLSFEKNIALDPRQGTDCLALERLQRKN
ncbi:hypothetical protein [Picosynechococcus sp. NKBG042902]|uniref:hypothetical protein n=1 Tax=Picosynechococcus sp. NKBG042902 TaxID=490193 RepID=UPI0012692318|nr:hypothetical protein [Picosynechococcus sp. NKBG042902]